LRKVIILKVVFIEFEEVYAFDLINEKEILVNIELNVFFCYNIEKEFCLLNKKF
jgi:hypothetical protein